MAFCTYSDIRTMTNLAIADIANDDLTSLIDLVTYQLNQDINIKIIREKVEYLDETRKNDINGSNTVYYVKNWKGNYLADMDNDGDVDISDIIVYQVDADDIETTLTISSINDDDCKITLSTAPGSGVYLYITYCYAPVRVGTVDPLIKLACIYLTAAYAYSKINIGKAPQIAYGNVKIYRHMKSFELYFQKYLKIIEKINQRTAIKMKEGSNIL